MAPTFVRGSFYLYRAAPATQGQRYPSENGPSAASEGIMAHTESFVNSF